MEDLGGPREAAARPSGGEAHQLAAAALLVEAATMDDSFDAAERATILELLSGRFGLSAEEAHGSLRFGLGRGTTEAEVDAAAAQVIAALRDRGHPGVR